MKCWAKLEIPHSKAVSLERALEPDNAEAPEGLQVECYSVEGMLECRVTVDCSDPRSMLTLRNTVDDILVNLKAAVDAIESAGGSK